MPKVFNAAKKYKIERKNKVKKRDLKKLQIESDSKEIKGELAAGEIWAGRVIGFYSKFADLESEGLSEVLLANFASIE